MTDKRAYYTCPIKALYMTKEFWVEYYRERFTKEPIRRTNVTTNMLTVDCRYALSDRFIIEGYKYYIHSDSMGVFEPKEGDVMCTVRADATSTEVVMSDIRAEEFKNLIKRQGAKIIQRNGKPFFWPEWEE